MGLSDIQYDDIKKDVLDKISQLDVHLFFIYSIDESKLIYLNSCFEKIWELSLKGRLDDVNILINTIHPDDQTFVQNFLSRTIKDGEKSQKLEFRIITKSGKEKVISSSVFLIEKDNQRFISGFAHDTTEYKKFEKTLFEISAKKNSTLEILTHELTGPLTMIQNLSFEMQKGAEVKNFDNISMYTSLIADTCERSIKLIKSLVNHEILASSQVTMNIDRMDLGQKIGDVMEFYRIAEKKILKNFQIRKSHEKVFIEVDEIKFIQVINNLISNAIKFTHDNGLIEVTITDNADNVVISVKDDGIGIPEKYKENIFDKFTKARRLGLKGEDTVGLGLSICKKIVELHNGKIWFESQENVGTTFFIKIPKGLNLKN